MSSVMVEGEYLLCAAIWVPDGVEHPFQPYNVDNGLVFCGWRHPTIRPQIVAMYYPNWVEEKELPIEEQPRVRILRSEVQGFLTSVNRFVGRVEGMAIAKANDQILPNKHVGKDLFSEDIY